MTIHPSGIKQTEFSSEIISEFEKRSGISSPEYEIKSRNDGDYLVLYFAQPNDRFYRILGEVLDNVSEDNPLKERTTIKKRVKAPRNRLKLPETQYLRHVIQDSLVVTRHSFEDDFFSRYINTVFGAEADIKANANHVVYGRRGSGKSSLLAYLLHTIKITETPFAWIDMQTYSELEGNRIIAEVLKEIVSQLKDLSEEQNQFSWLYFHLESLLGNRNDPSEKDITNIVPKIKKAISPIAERHGKLIIFLDDIHLLQQDVQPLLLTHLWSIARGNRTFLKISGVEYYTRIWDPDSRRGLEPTEDVIAIDLDLNLTSPEKSISHIGEILNAHARYCGLPDFGYISGDGVLKRLLWVAAAVPRDALDIFGQGISRALVKDQKLVSITSINEASSLNAQQKFESIENGQTRELFDSIRNFCLNNERINAFLVDIRGDNPQFNRIKELIALKLLHIIVNSFTPSSAGKRSMALMLDYGFYIGQRAAKSVTLFKSEPTRPQAKELRKLPTFPL